VKDYAFDGLWLLKVAQQGRPDDRKHLPLSPEGKAGIDGGPITPCYIVR
jgi:hypothetical protein